MSRFGGYEDLAFVAELYDFDPFYAERPDVDFYVDLAGSAEGKVLELGCGTGRILIPTAAAGCEIVGLDISNPMLAKCREKLQRQPKKVQKRVRLAQGDMSSFDLKETFALVTAPFRSFQHLISVEEQISCLRWHVQKPFLPAIPGLPSLCSLRPANLAKRVLRAALAR